MRKLFVEFTINHYSCSYFRADTYAIDKRRQQLQQRREDLHAAMYFHEDESIELDTRDQQIDEEWYDAMSSFPRNALYLIS